jgi:hypothetical protein
MVRGTRQKVLFGGRMNMLADLGMGYLSTLF